MHNSPISKDLYNNISNVLMGKTTVKVELPASLTEAAQAAAKELRTLTEGTIVAETKRNILRKHLKEGVAKCGCQLTPEMVTRFEEVVAEADVKMPTQKAALATPAEVKSKTAPKGGSSSAEGSKLAAPAKAAAAINTAGMKSMKKEETQPSEIELGLREFLTQLSEEEVTTLRNIINENR
jgi:molybdopterin converting factor small subunit